jgi:hypothetical protein
MQELTIALAIAVPLGIAALNTWINITIKFAPDAAHARREVTLIFARVTMWISSSVVLGQLVWQIVSPMSNQRVSFLLVLLDSFTLYNVYVMWLHGVILNMLLEHLRLMGKLSDTIRLIGESLDKLVSAYSN